MLKILEHLLYSLHFFVVLFAYFVISHNFCGRFLLNQKKFNKRNLIRILLGCQMVCTGPQMIGQFVASQTADPEVMSLILARPLIMKYLWSVTSKSKCTKYWVTA